MSIYLPISTQPIVVTRRQSDDLPQEVKGKAHWTEGVGYQAEVPTEQEGQYRIFDVEFINDKWYQLASTSEGFKTTTEGELQPNQWGLGYWPEDHPKNPKNIVLTTVPSFGEYIEQGLKTMASSSAGKAPTSSKGKKKQEPIEEEEITTTRWGNFQGKAPNVFDGDRTKSKAFIADLKIYFRINRNHPDVKNYHTIIWRIY